MGFVRSVRKVSIHVRRLCGICADYAAMTLPARKAFGVCAEMISFPARRVFGAGSACADDILACAEIARVFFGSCGVYRSLFGERAGYLRSGRVIALHSRRVWDVCGVCRR